MAFQAAKSACFRSSSFCHMAGEIGVVPPKTPANSEMRYQASRIMRQQLPSSVSFLASGPNVIPVEQQRALTATNFDMRLTSGNRRVDRLTLVRKDPLVQLGSWPGVR